MVKVILGMSFILFVGAANGFVSTTEHCEKKFVARVEKINSPEGTITFRSTEEVVLKPTEILKGNVGEVEKVNVLKFSTLSPKIGESYLVETNNGKICSFTSLKEDE